MTSKAGASVIFAGSFSAPATHPRAPTGFSPSPGPTEGFWLHRFLLPKATLLDLRELALGQGSPSGKSVVMKSQGVGGADGARAAGTGNKKINTVRFKDLRPLRVQTHPSWPLLLADSGNIAAGGGGGWRGVCSHSLQNSCYSSRLPDAGSHPPSQLLPITTCKPPLSLHSPN